MPPPSGQNGTPSFKIIVKKGIYKTPQPIDLEDPEFIRVYTLHMPSNYPRRAAGFSLVETIIAVFIMSVVISAGLVSLGQVNRLGEKSREQSIADFYLRAECEQLRALDWSEVETLTKRINNYQDANRGDAYSDLLSLSAERLTELNMTAATKSTALNSSGETGKNIFRVTLYWSDQSGRNHEESRLLIITEGGLSAE